VTATKTGNNEFSRLLRRSLLAALVCVGLVTVCYLFVDRPVASFVHQHKLASHAALKWLTYPPPIVQAWTPVVLAVLVVRRAFGTFRRWEVVLVAACVSMILADQFRESLSYAFGRYWPETWIDNNPSYIQNGAYGFHPFHAGSAYGSFPSGHMARVLGFAAVVWIAYPRWRWACVIAALATAAGLLGMNYHFVSDVIAGSFVGSIVGMYAAHFAATLPAVDKQP
jgi:membrane-associated phospholipid phosphatase